MRILWSTVSNAALKFRRIKAVIFPLSIAVRMSLLTRRRAVSVPWYCLYADWYGSDKEKVIIWSEIRFDTILSIVFPRDFKLETQDIRASYKMFILFDNGMSSPALCSSNINYRIWFTNHSREMCYCILFHCCLLLLTGTITLLSMGLDIHKILFLGTYM